MSIRKIGVVLWCVVLVASASFAAKPVEFEPMGVECGLAFFPRACVIDVSGDGQTVLFRDQVWRPDGTVEMIGGPPEGFIPIAISDDGSTIVGNIGRSDGPLGNRVEAAIWLGGNNWQALGGLPNTSPCGSSYTSSFDVTGDGSKVVGLAWVGMQCAGGAHAFEWTAETGMVDLGSIVSDRSSRINTVSADGSRLAGWSDTSFGSRLAAVWDDFGAADPYWIEPDGSNIFLGEAQGISSDGSIVVGGGLSLGDDPTVFFQGWKWEAGSAPVALGAVKSITGGFADGQHIARDVSDDGSVVVGQDTLFNLGEQWAWIWTEDEGIEFLQQYVIDRSKAGTKAMICDPSRNVPEDPCQDRWDLWNVSAVSNDGKIIFATGRNPNGFFEAVRITLP